MSDKDHTIAALSICLVCVFTPKPVAIGFTLAALVIVFFFDRRNIL